MVMIFASGSSEAWYETDCRRLAPIILEHPSIGPRFDSTWSNAGVVCGRRIKDRASALKGDLPYQKI